MSEGTGSKPWDADMEYNNLRIAHDQLFDKVIALRAENTRLRGILRDLAGCEDQDLIKGHVVMSTLEVDALRAEVERLNGRFDTAHQVIAHRENECAMLRAEVAAQGKTIGEWQDFLCQVSDMLWGGELAWACDGGLKKMGGELNRRLSEVAALKAELRQCQEANHAVAVCRDHTGDIIRRDGCVICDLESAKDELAKYTEPLTDDQCREALRIALAPFIGPATLRVLDAAIRLVRRGE